MANQIGSMQALIEMFNNAFEELEINVPLSLLENLAVIVHDAMSVQTRSYHNLEHIFNFSNPKNPVLHLAALFHDIVYYQVDKGFHFEIEPLVRPYIEEVDGEIKLVERSFLQDRILLLFLAIFDFEAADILSISNGLNEFLSAIVMHQLLGNIIPEKELIKIAVCIEATIPFRGKNNNGQSHFEVLKSRLSDIFDKNQPNFSDEEIDDCLKLAIIFSNKDVETFADPSVARFLDITWKLLPESNIALRSRGTYTIREYRIAMQRMQSFLSSLHPENIFNQFKGIPTDFEYEHMQKQARHNIIIAVEYLRIKLIGIAILEALAEYSGGDAPLSLFVGDIQTPEDKGRRISDFLPNLDLPEHINPITDDVYQLLSYGRYSDTTFDLKNSPLSLYVYKSMNQSESKTFYKKCLRYFDHQIGFETFLDAVPKKILVEIARGCALMAYTRRERLLTLATKYA